MIPDFHKPTCSPALIPKSEAAFDRPIRSWQPLMREKIAYQWPAPFGANSNAYYATLIAGMGLPDVRIDGELWAPSSNRLLLDEDTLLAIRAS